MSLFAYEVLDAHGRSQKGEIESDSERSARQQLKSRQLIVRRLELIEREISRDGISAGSHLSSSDTVLFLQQLATLSEAGMPLVEALASIAEGMGKSGARRTVTAIRQYVLEGGSLAEALRAEHMDEVVCNMIAAGEETGQLEAVCARLAQLLEHRQQLNQELMSATLYPAIILGFGLLVMVFLMTVVVPKMVMVFERAGGELPVLTKIVLASSDFLLNYGGVLVLMIASMLLVYKLMMRRESVRAIRDGWMIRIPGLGSLLCRINTARYTRTLGMLLSGGVPTLAAMHIANQNWSMQPLKDIGIQARESVREGAAIAESLKVGSYIPHLAIQLLSVGEQSGKLDAMLLRVADHFEREVSRTLKRMLTIAEPLLVLFMALAVGALALAILLPIAEMNELVR